MYKKSRTLNHPHHTQALNVMFALSNSRSNILIFFIYLLLRLAHVLYLFVRLGQVHDFVSFQKHSMCQSCLDQALNGVLGYEVALSNMKWPF
jgi:hypothetical protein